MKKLFLAVLIISLTLLVGCIKKDYRDQMDKLETPEKVTLVTFLLEESVWTTHKLELNEEETLYYAPKKVRIGTKTYLNDEEMYFILKANASLLELNYEIIDEETLRIIFEG